jgi:hypothetical protein
MELLIVLAFFAMLAVGAVLGGADSRPGLNESREWGLHSWHREER